MWTSRQGDTVIALQLFIYSFRTRTVQSIYSVPGISDHDAVLATIACVRPLPVIGCPRKVFMYQRGNYDLMIRALVEYSQVFVEFSLTYNLDQLWKCFKNKVLDLINSYIPSKTISHSPKNQSLVHYGS